MHPTNTANRAVFRLLHSSGDVLIVDRHEALARLVALPGARLFIMPL